MKILLLIISILFLSACGEDNKSSAKLEDGEAYLTYSTANTHAWTEIGPLSSNGAGECSISGGNVIYTKKDADFSGEDRCYEAIPHCSVPSYSIDFSVPNPELAAINPQCM